MNKNTARVNLSPDVASDLVVSALERVAVPAAVAISVARALIGAQTDGQSGHGLSRLRSYVEQVQSGKVVPNVVPALHQLSDSAIRIDAAHGFAYPAMALAVSTLSIMAKTSGIAMAAIAHSHHFGQAGAHVERLAEQGLIGILFGNTPKAMAFWGGSTPMMGTNPLAFAAPVEAGPPLVIDLALSTVARGKIMAAKKAGQAIPEGWALDAQGAPTTDPDHALAGSMVPLGGSDGGAKGAALALMIEILAGALTASNFGFEASSFLDGDGPPPDMGCVLIALDPQKISGGNYFMRMTTLLEAMAQQDGVRLPGSSRLENRKRVAEQGLFISTALHDELHCLAGATD